jgi:hypothetical protein
MAKVRKSACAVCTVSRKRCGIIGAGYHNLAVRERGTVEEYKSWEWYDSRCGVRPHCALATVEMLVRAVRLTPLGERQARALTPVTADLPIDIVFVSSLSRAIQTGLLAIERVRWLMRVRVCPCVHVPTAGRALRIPRVHPRAHWHPPMRQTPAALGCVMLCQKCVVCACMHACVCVRVCL